MRKADNLPPSCAVVTKSGNLNFLELSGPLQPCNGNALPFKTITCVIFGEKKTLIIKEIVTLSSAQQQCMILLFYCIIHIIDFSTYIYIHIYTYIYIYIYIHTYIHIYPAGQRTVSG